MLAELSPNSFKILLSQSLERTFSPVVVQLIQATLKQDVEIEEVARLISLDPILTASVIGIANSPHYSYGKNVSNVERAIVVLGLKEILKLAVSISIKKNLSPKSSQSSEAITQDWRMTIWAGVAAERIAARLGNIPKGQAYLTAILKDIPLILMSNISPVCLNDHDSLIDFCTAQLKTENRTWGLTHPEMSQILADAWDLPEEVARAMRLHHTPAINLPRNEPLTLAVALSTRWSELIQGQNASPEDLFNFELILCSSLNIQNPLEVEELRLETLSDFREILVQLDISETPPDQRLYETSLSSLKDYYFLALDLADTAQDLPTLAQALGNHLSIFWQIPTWDLALKLPHNNNYLFFTSNEGMISQCGPLPMEDWTQKSYRKNSFPFNIKSKNYGELLIPKNLIMGQKLQTFNAYLSFINHSLGSYYNNRLKAIAQSGMLEDLPIAVASLDLNGELVSANKEFIHFFDMDNLDNVGNIPKLIDEKFDLDFYDSWPSLIAKSIRENVGKLICVHSPKSQPQLYLATLRQSKAGSAPRLLLFIQSVSEVSSMEVQALKQRDFLEQLFTSMQDIVLTINSNGIITWTPPALNSLNNKNFFDISRPANIDLEWNANILKKGEIILSPLEAGIKIEDKRVGLFEFIVSPLGNKAADFLVVGRDLTSIRRLEAKVRQQAIRDGLTGLYNHSYFHNLLESQVAKQHPAHPNLGLLFMDLDGFKRINDTEGHIEGDTILKQLGFILQNNLRQGRDQAARYGGDEFAVLATNITPELLEKIAQRLIDQVDAHTDGKVGLSIGISMLEPGQIDSSAFLRQADKALYAAKASGGRRFSWG